MRILLIGDVIGRPGRDVVGAELPNLREKLCLDFVILNAENAAGGFGLTRNIANELFAIGVDVLTTGNHWLDQREILTFIDDEDRICAIDGAHEILVEVSKQDYSVDHEAWLRWYGGSGPIGPGMLNARPRMSW